jgi:Fur family ferric uptake transcriptional regulator
MVKRVEEAKKVLDTYIAVAGKRKTSERYAILEAVYDFDGHFTVEQLNEALERKKFVVSRATLYNTLRLFLKINLVVKHRLANETTYEVVSNSVGHCHQVCTMCGKVTEVNLPEVEKALKEVSLRRFRKEGFALYVYGVCSSCMAKLSRLKTMSNQEKTERKSKNSMV